MEHREEGWRMRRWLAPERLGKDRDRRSVVKRAPRSANPAPLDFFFLS